MSEKEGTILSKSTFPRALCVLLLVVLGIALLVFIGCGGTTEPEISSQHLLRAIEFKAAFKTWSEDWDDDGKPDHHFIDEDGDGNPDRCFVDNDEDGNAEEQWVDQDDDGDWDTVVENPDDDGDWDSGKMDTDRDGKFDHKWTDSNDNGKFDDGEIEPIDPEPVDGPRPRSGG